MLSGQNFGSMVLTRHTVLSRTTQLHRERVLTPSLSPRRPQLQPSSLREGFITVPNVTWADVGALSDVREELNAEILVSGSAAVYPGNELGVCDSCVILKSIMHK